MVFWKMVYKLELKKHRYFGDITNISAIWQTTKHFPAIWQTTKFHLNISSTVLTLFDIRTYVCSPKSFISWKEKMCKGNLVVLDCSLPPCFFSTLLLLCVLELFSKARYSIHKSVILIPTSCVLLTY